MKHGGFKKSLIGIFLFLSVVEVNAAWTQRTKIKELRAQANGMYVILDSFTNSDESINCDNEGFWIPDTAQNYQARISMLLAAFMSKQDLKISYYDCDGIYHNIGTVSLVP